MSNPPYNKESALPKENIHFHPERALEVAAIIRQSYVEGKGLFRHEKIEVSPEHRAVEGIESGYDKACLLFCAIATDRGVQSRIHYPKFRQGYNLDRRNVLPTHIASSTFSQVKDLFTELYGVGLTQVIREIHESSRIITEKYDGDPRKIFDDVPCVHDAVQILSDRKSPKKLPGFGAQVTKLLLKNFTELDLVHFSNAEEAQPKIDLHQIRISIGTGILRFDEEGKYHASAIAKALGEGYEKLCREGKLDGRQFNSLLWAVGSHLCNVRDERACFGGCPLYGTVCTKLPHANYRSIGERNDGTVDTRVDVRTPKPPLFTVQELVGLEKNRVSTNQQTVVSQRRARNDKSTEESSLETVVGTQSTLFS